MKREVVYLVDYQFQHRSSSIESYFAIHCSVQLWEQKQKVHTFSPILQKDIFHSSPDVCQLFFMIAGFFIFHIKILPIFHVVARIKTNIFKAPAAMPGMK